MSNQNLEWITEKRKISDLIPYEKNPRILTPKQQRDLQASLEKFNLAEIPVINTDNKIVAGHQRLKILILLGRGNEEIDVRVPNRPLTDKEFQEYNIRSNKNTGDWDNDKLLEIPANDLINWGFESEELNLLDEDELPELTDNLQPYQKTHVLLSFHPDKFEKVKPLLDKILEIEGIEYEQGSN